MPGVRPQAPHRPLTDAGRAVNCTGCAEDWNSVPRRKDGMRTVAPVFQLYRFSDDDVVWWRLVSPNGRGLARASVPGPHPDAVRLELDGLAGRLPGLETTIRLTPEYRWRWSLREDGLDVAQGIGDQDRRVRCVHACRTFIQLVPEARIDPVVATYRRAGQSAVLLRSADSRRGPSGS